MAALGGPPWRHGADIDWMPPRDAIAPRRFSGDEADLMGHLSTNPVSGATLTHLDSVKGWLQYVESSSPEGLRFIAGELQALADSLRSEADAWAERQR